MAIADDSYHKMVDDMKQSGEGMRYNPQAGAATPAGGHTVDGTGHVTTKPIDKWDAAEMHGARDAARTGEWPGYGGFYKNPTAADWAALERGDLDPPELKSIKDPDLMDVDPLDRLSAGPGRSLARTGDAPGWAPTASHAARVDHGAITVATRFVSGAPAGRSASADESAVRPCRCTPVRRAFGTPHPLQGSETSYIRQLTDVCRARLAEHCSTGPHAPNLEAEEERCRVPPPPSPPF